NSTGGSISGSRNGWAGEGGSLILNTTNDFEITGNIQLTSGSGGDRCGIECPTSRKAGGKLSIGNYVGVNISGVIDTRGQQCSVYYYNQTIVFFTNSLNLREMDVKTNGRVYFGGSLNVSNLIVSGVLGPVGSSYYPGGNLTITANIINLTSTGNISAMGGDIPATGFEKVGGYGGILNITANTAYLDGILEIRGGDGNVGRGEGGWAGKLFMSIKNDYALRGSILGKGGASGQVWSQVGCNGGTAIIYNPWTNVTISGIVNLSMGNGGDCYIKSRGGLLNITAYNLSLSSSITVIGNVSGVISLNAANNLTINSTLDARTGGLTTGGVNGSIYLEYSSELNLTSSTINPNPYIARNTTNARIQYLQAVSSANAINYDNAIKIASNNISVDISSYSQLNKSAELWFYNTVASNPVPLRNNIACPSTICAVVSSGTTYKFNVTSFSDYSVGDGTPIITIISPLAANYTTQRVDFNITTDRDSSYCNFSLDNKATIDMTRLSGTYFNFTNSTMTQGNHNISFSCNDSNYNIWGNTSLRYFFLDYAYPNVTINSPKNTTLHYAPTMYFNATSIDNSNYTETCKYSLDGSANVSMEKSNATYFTYAYAGIIHGFHNLTISCNDSYGNTGEATEYSFRVIFTDLTMSSIVLPSLFYSNYSIIYLNISNEGLAQSALE
ncbi:MAG: hypothetical protein NT076_02505, partial [Candidatus Pacearchaeota archaeon]|nr:hypothetical protein [Candidatus Pacearchaeota archaeon]